MGFSKELYIISSFGAEVNSVTTVVTISEKIIQITPIMGEQLTPDLSATPTEQFHAFISYPKTNINTIVSTREPIIELHTAGLETFFHNKPKTYGPINQPASVPQLIPIIYAIAATLNSWLIIANATDIAINTRQRIRIVILTFLSLASLLILPL